MKDKAFELCKKVHSNQKYQLNGKEVPYYNHCLIVANIIKLNAETELDIDFAMTVAYLHDTIEDTQVTYDDLKKQFGKRIADGVLAVTKDDSLPHEKKLDDSLARIQKHESREVAAVKMADRICNLYEIPRGWSKAKCEAYIADAEKILSSLGWASEKLSRLLYNSIQNYKTKLQF